MQGFPGKHKLGLVGVQRFDIFGVVIECLAVTEGGFTPVRFGLKHGQTQHQRTEKRLVENQLGARGGEFLFPDPVS